jgi:hypothetical protein
LQQTNLLSAPIRAKQRGARAKPGRLSTLLDTISAGTQGEDILAGSRFTVSRPGSHKFTPLFQSIGPPVSLLGLISDDVCECCFCDLSREVCLIASPIPKAAPEPMNCRADDAKASQKLGHGDV